MADTHPAADTEAERRRLVAGDKGSHLSGSGPQVLHIFLRGRRKVPRFLRPRALRGRNGGLRAGDRTPEREVWHHFFPVPSRRGERKRTVRRHGDAGQKKVRRGALGAKSPTSRRRQGEDQRRNRVRIKQPETKKAHRQGRGRIRSLDEPGTRGVTPFG